MFSWPKNQPKTTEIDFSRYFHFKSFPPLSHTHEPLRHALLCQAFTAPSSLHCAGTSHTDAPRSQTRPSPELCRSTSITIAIASIGITPIGVDRDHQNQRDCDRDLADLARSVDWRFARSRSRSHRENICPSGFYLSF